MVGASAKLHPELITWAIECGWSSFAPFQEVAFAAILSSDDDILISSATSSGKTEAAFLPLLTLASEKPVGASFLCISPRKALINDQYRRLLVPSRRVGVPLVKWHGEASKAAKDQLVREPRGGVLITPESLEGWFVRRPASIPRVFSWLDAVVIDEIHDFLSGSRGHQLSSLLGRLDEACGRRIRRVGLSGTLGDIMFAQKWLCPQEPRSVKVLETQAPPKSLLSSIRGYEVKPANDGPSGPGHRMINQAQSFDGIARNLIQAHRDGTYLVFAGSKRNVEALCDCLKRHSSSNHGRDRFRAHHGNLGQKPRERLEEQLRGGVPLTVVTTTTLELGIDIGTIDGIDHIGAPTSLAAFRQKIGRSGRRDAPAMVTVHVAELKRECAISIMDRLRLTTVRALSAVNLICSRFVEPPATDATMLTVLLQQTLSTVRQLGGANAIELYRRSQGAFAFERVSKSSHLKLLDYLVEASGQLKKATDGKYQLTGQGELLVTDYEFFAAFYTESGWQVWQTAELIGNISEANIVCTGDKLCLDGRYWRTVSIDRKRSRVNVVPTSDGQVPLFDSGEVGQCDEALAMEMRRVMADQDLPDDCDKLAVTHLTEGRLVYSGARLDSEYLIEDDGDCHIFTWRGTKFNELFAIALRKMGLACLFNEVAVTIPRCDASTVRASFVRGIPTLDELGAFLEALSVGKYDKWVPEELIRDDWKLRTEAVYLNLVSFMQLELVGSDPPAPPCHR